MAVPKELSRRQKLLLRVKSVLPILKDSWVSLNEHIINGDRAAINKWIHKRPFLRSKLDNIPRDVLNPVCTAAESGDVGIFDLLLDAGFSPFADDCRKEEIKTTPKRRCLHLAAHNGHLDLVKKLVEVHQEDVNSYGGGNTCLQWAVLGRHAHVVEYLLAHGADPNIGDQMEEDMLYVMKGSVNFHYWYDECYPLGKAFNRGLVDIALMLISAGVDVTKVRISGNTLISNFVSKSGIRDITQMLFERGAYMPIRDLFEFVCYGDFDEHSSLIMPVWQFLFDMNICLHHLKSVPTHYRVPVMSSHTRTTDLIQQISDSRVFSDEVPLAEVFLKIQTQNESENSLFEGFHMFEEDCQSYLTNPDHEVCCLKYLCCLAVRESVGVLTTRKLNSLPIDDRLKRFIRLEQL